MKKFYKIMGTIAIIFLVCGIIFTGIGFVMGGQNHTLKSNKWMTFVINPSVEKQDYTVLDEFDSIDLKINSGDVVIKEGEEFAIEYALYDGAKYKVENETLSIEEADTGFIHLGFGWKSENTYLTIYVPKDTKLNIKKLNVDMGDITIFDIDFENINISADMGDIDLKNIEVSNLDVDADMGDVNFEGVADGKINIEVDMGDVDLKGYLGCDIIVESDMGDVDIYTYYNSQYYKYDIDTDMGDKEINNNGGEHMETDSNFEIKANSDMGDVMLTFADK